MTRKLHVYFCIFMLFGFGNYIAGQDKRNIHVADSVLNVRGEIFFSFNINRLTSLIEKFISVDRKKDSLVFAYANKSGFGKFLALNIAFQLRTENFRIARLKNAEVVSLNSLYPSYSRYLDIMQAFHDQYQEYCEVYDAGLSVKGRKLLMLKIASPLNHSDTRPAVLLTSSIHGNELTGYKLLLCLSGYLLENYGKDDLVTKLMDQTEIWINPLANPDGTFFGGDNTVLEATRFNANNLDLNRNFPDPDEGNHPDNSVWQPETIAMMKFYKDNAITLSANFHTGNELVNYPWDTWSRLHADNVWYKLISRQYVDLLHSKSNNSYMTEFDNGIVDGYAWYRVTGGRQDYVNYFAQGREVTIELSEEGIPDSMTLVKYWEYNRESMLHFIEQSLLGLHGRITDAETGLPIKAKVELLGHDKDNSYVTSDSVHGEFYRLLASGTYSLFISSPGYVNFNQSIDLPANQLKYLEIKLKPANEVINVYPNPFNRNITLQFREDSVLTRIKISIIDLLGKVVYTNIIQANNKIVTIPVPQIPDGLYLLKLEAENFVKQFELIRME